MRNRLSSNSGLSKETASVRGTFSTCWISAFGRRSRIGLGPIFMKCETMCWNRARWSNGATTGLAPSTFGRKTRKRLLDSSLKSVDCTTSITSGVIPFIDWLISTFDVFVSLVSLFGSSNAQRNARGGVAETWLGWMCRLHGASDPTNERQNHGAPAILANAIRSTLIFWEEFLAA